MRARRSRRGFTLLEMMIAVVIGAISVVMAAQVAKLVVRQNAKGKQRTDFSARSRLLGRQLRADLKLAGIGATGAIAVDTGSGQLGQLAITTSSNFQAIPVIIGANNVNGAFGGATFQPFTDAIQIVVPNPALLVRTNLSSPLNQPVLTFSGPPLADASVLAGCRMVYISDHSSATGAGRAQIAFLSSALPTQVTIDGQLKFTVAPGSDVMCARISTYWVDNTFVLRRNDVQLASNLVFPGGGKMGLDTSGPSMADSATAPGVLDMQIAYRISSEAYRMNGVAVPGSVDEQWAFIANAPNASGRMATDQNWFEVRMVRANILGRTMRRIEHNLDTVNYPRLEDAAALPPLAVRWSHTAEWITATETITNLRYFDMGAPERVPPEPY